MLGFPAPSAGRSPAAVPLTPALESAPLSAELRPKLRRASQDGSDVEWEDGSDPPFFGAVPGPGPPLSFATGPTRGGLREVAPVVFIRFAEGRPEAGRAP